MGFRDYDPGLNRFTSRDMYNGALADLGLGSDPYTSNRYVFGGGNPISMIEIDGHESWDSFWGGMADAFVENTEKAINDAFAGFVNAIAYVADSYTCATGKDVGAYDDCGLTQQRNDTIHATVGAITQDPGGTAVAAGAEIVSPVSEPFQEGAYGAGIAGIPFVIGELAGGKGSGSIDDVAGAAAGAAARADVWELNQWARGVEIESTLATTEYADWFNVGSLHNGYFPLVDFQKGNALISLKTVSSSSPGGVSRMRDHIDELGAAMRSGASVDGVPAQIGLDIRTNAGGVDAFASLIDYGRYQGVPVSIREFP